MINYDIDIDKEMRLIISNICNINCKHCYLTEENKKGLDVIDDIIPIIESIKTMENKPKKILLFAHGEPMYTKIPIKDLILFTKEMKSLGIKIKIQTNLMYKLTDEMIELFKLFSTVKTSFDLHSRFSTINQLILWYKNIKKLSSIIGPLKVEITLNKYNIQKGAKKWIRVLTKMVDKGYIERYSFHALQIMGYAEKYRNELEYTKEEFIQFISEIVSHHVPENATIDAFLDKKYFSRYSLKSGRVARIEQDGTYFVGSLLKNESSICSSCLVCDDFDICGGNDSITDKCYFDKKLYELSRKDDSND